MVSPDGKAITTAATAGGGGTAGTGGASSNKGKIPTFPVGQTGRRELRRALLRSTNPADTITRFQQVHSLHSMFSRAFGTKTIHEAKAEKEKKDADDNDNKKKKDTVDMYDKAVPVEALDTDSAITFLSHLGVSQHEVHKRIADTLLKQLEGEIRKRSPSSGNEAPLLNLLKSCWIYCTTITELRPVLWAVLKQLGEQTPAPVLEALGERIESGDSSSSSSTTKKTMVMKHMDIFRPLPPLLKRLVWEADWDRRVPPTEIESKNVEVKEYIKLIQSTLLCDAVDPLVESYCKNPKLVEAANQPFVATFRERRLFTKLRRALRPNTGASVANAANTNTTTGSITTASLTGTANTTNDPKGGGAAATNTTTTTSKTTGEAVSQLRYKMLQENTHTYRPKLLYAIISILMSRHGSTPNNLMACADHLHCCLAADLLLSVNNLPKSYQQILSLALILDDSVQAGLLSDVNIAKIQNCLRLIFQTEDDPDNDADNNNKKGNENDDDNNNTGSPNKKRKKGDDKEGGNPKKHDKTAFKRQLNKIIGSGLSTMKEADPQNLFVNPVTDEIAPGYSRIITKPMCISTMEAKVLDNQYATIRQWEEDVKLMFKNCIDYNRGSAGQWFRGEAQRQKKVFQDEIYKQAKKHYQAEAAKRDAAEKEIKERKRKAENMASIAAGATTTSTGSGTTGIGIGIGGAKDKKDTALIMEVTPLPSVNKKRKKEKPNEDTTTTTTTNPDTKTTGFIMTSTNTNKNKNKDDYTPSMPALASMLLADPFVVRLLFDRVLRSLRLDVTRGSFLPAGHSVIPSVLQILYISQWSNQLCAVRGKRFMVPDSGLTNPDTVQKSKKEESGKKGKKKEKSKKDDPLATVPYDALRRYIPLLSRLLLEAELDKRVVVGGDLHDASLSSVGSSRPDPPSTAIWKAVGEANAASAALWYYHQQVVVSLLESAIVHICRPGNSFESSLTITFPKFSIALTNLSTITGASVSSGYSNPLWHDRAFFICMINSIIRHKSKLHHSARDVVVQTWLEWLAMPAIDMTTPDENNNDSSSEKKKKSKKKKNNKDMAKGSITSPSHECLILLLNEWSALGNILLPRDKLLQFSLNAVKAVNQSETSEHRQFAYLWKQSAVLTTTSSNDDANNSNNDNDNDTSTSRNDSKNSDVVRDFQPIKEQYMRMLNGLPEDHQKQWKQQVNILEEEEDEEQKKDNDDDMSNNDAGDNSEKNDKDDSDEDDKMATD